MTTRRWRRGLASAAIAVAFSLVPATTGTPSAAPEPPRATRIMPLGDSITDGADAPGGYRVRLAHLLTASSTPFDFVGTQQNGPAEFVDRDHEGHSGWRIDELELGARSWVAELEPDVVLLLAGTNDVWQRFELARAPDRMLALLVTIDRASPGVRIVVSTIPPLRERELDRVALNAALPGVVATARALGISVVLVPAGDSLTEHDLYDNAHPNHNGHDKLAAGFYPAARAAASSPG